MLELHLTAEFTAIHVNVLLSLVKIVCDFCNFPVQCRWQGVTRGDAGPIWQMIVVQIPCVTEHPTLRGHIGVHDLLQLLGGDGGGGYLEGRVEGGEVDLEPVLVPPVQHHGLEPVTPEYFVRQIRAAGLKLCIARLICTLQHRDQLKLLLGELGGRDVIERGVLVNHMDNLQRPDEEDAALVAFVWGDIEGLHLLSDLSLKTDVTLQ